MYSHTASGRDADVRLPKSDDIYYYYTRSGDKVWSLYESGLQAKRAENAENVGKMAFYPGKSATGRSSTLSNGVPATSFVFGNPTMGYIDIWGFIADNRAKLDAEIGYMNALGVYTTITYAALEEADAITSLSRYLPPMHAIVLKLKVGEAAATSLSVTLNTNRIVTAANQITRPLPGASPAPRKSPMTTALPIDRNDQSPIIRVAPILNANDPVPAVSVNAPSSITNRRYLDFGIRVYYAFSFENTSSRPRRHPHARDTRDHHNRYLWW